MVFAVSGPDAAAQFAGEIGGHRWQRVPPTEKRGRVHSSTITVAVLEDDTVIDHRTGRTWRFRDNRRGRW